MKNISDDKLCLPNGNIITFNDEQYIGIKKILNWLSNNQNNYFTLAGYAGTGKTTIVKKIIDKYSFGTIISAPTHKAKKVIVNKTGMGGATLQSLLGLRPDVNLDDFNPNDPKFNSIALPKINEYNLVIIDEASMINLELFELIKSKTLNTRTKVLFIGDPAQIPPIGENESVVFYDNDIDKHWLTKIERQNIRNPLVLVYNALRNNLDKPNDCFERFSKINEYDEGVIFTNDKNFFRKELIDKFNSIDFKKNIDYCKLIAWRNQTVLNLNRIIRNELYGKNVDIIEVGDILMGYRSIIDERYNINIIDNGADYRVVEKSNLETNKYDIKGYNVKLQEVIENYEYRYVDIFIVDINDFDNLHLYAELHDFLRYRAKSNKKLWTDYYKFRRNNILLSSITHFKNGDNRNSHDIISKDMDFGYAITGHKSQGSTYSHAFIMENDIDANWLVKERNQIKYVALTRPSISAIVLTDKINN